MTDQQIKEFISTKVLSKISDYSLQFALRRGLFNPENKIDWQKFYKDIIYEMPELKGVLVESIR